MVMKNFKIAMVCGALLAANASANPFMDTVKNVATSPKTWLLMTGIWEAAKDTEYNNILVSKPSCKLMVFDQIENVSVMLLSHFLNRPQNKSLWKALTFGIASVFSQLDLLAMILQKFEWEWRKTKLYKIPVPFYSLLSKVFAYYAGASF